MSKKKKNASKRNLLIIVGGLIIIAVVVGIVINSKKGTSSSEQKDSDGTSTTEEYVKVLEDGTKLNISEELQKTKKVDDLEISNIQLKATEGMTTLLADVKNISEKKTKEQMINVEVVDKEGKTLTELRGLINKLDPGAIEQLNIVVTADVSNAYDFKVSKVKSK